MSIRTLRKLLLGLESRTASVEAGRSARELRVAGVKRRVNVSRYGVTGEATFRLPENDGLAATAAAFWASGCRGSRTWVAFDGGHYRIREDGRIRRVGATANGSARIRHGGVRVLYERRIICTPTLGDVVSIQHPFGYHDTFVADMDHLCRPASLPLTTRVIDAKGPRTLPLLDAKTALDLGICSSDRTMINVGLIAVMAWVLVHQRSLPLAWGAGAADSSVR